MSLPEQSFNQEMQSAPRSDADSQKGYFHFSNEN